MNPVGWSTSFNDIYILLKLTQTKDIPWNIAV